MKTWEMSSGAPDSWPHFKPQLARFGPRYSVGQNPLAVAPDLARSIPVPVETRLVLLARTNASFFARQWLPTGAMPPSYGKSIYVMD